MYCTLASNKMPTLHVVGYSYNPGCMMGWCTLCQSHMHIGVFPTMPMQHKVCYISS